MVSRTRSVAIGVVLGVVVAGAVLGGLVLWDNASRETPSEVLVAFAMPGEDGATTAQLVVVVDLKTGKYRTEDASQAASIPGTTYTQLRDAYPFGGAEAVAAALGGDAVESGMAWVDVSPVAWSRLFARGVDVTITESFETFDDVTERYAEFPEGKQHVAGSDLRALVIGSAYLSPPARQGVMDALTAQSLEGLAKARPGSGIRTSLTDAQWAVFSEALSRK